MHFVYILYSDQYQRMYVGMSENVNRRLAEHNNGKTRSTKAYRPWRLVHVEEYTSRAEARKREVYLKSGFGRQWIKDKVLG